MDRFDKVWPLRGALATLVFVALLAWVPGPASAQLPPGEAWRTLETEHFRITYPAGLQDLAGRAGDRAEAAWRALEKVFVDPPTGRVELVVTDHADISNGFSRVFPSNRIVVFAPPPLNGFGLPHMDEWMELVITHEVAHIFHEDFARGLGGGLRKIFGRVPLEWPFFPGAATPGWVVEGLATVYESDLTKAGRVRGSFHEMVVRTAVLEGSFERIDQTSGDSPVWPGGQRDYVYGSLFLKHLHDLYGPQSIGAFVEAVAGQWVPYRLNSAAADAFGVSFSKAWEDWRDTLGVRYGALRERLAALAPLTEAEPVTEGGYYAWYPRPSPDGETLAFARMNGDSDARIQLMDLSSGLVKKLTRTNGLSTMDWTPSGDILFSQMNHTDSYRIRRDLFLAGTDGGITRITQGGRLDHPDVAPDGRQAVAVQEEGGANRLVMVDLSSGGIRPLTDYRDQELWAYPRWSPDGRWIAVSRWRAGAFFDLLLLGSDGEVLWEVTRDRAIDNAPAWSPDGRWLLWSSDRSGIPNLFAVAIDPASGEPGSTKQVTNLLGGGAYPSVDPAGRWIHFSSYHADGWRIERIPFHPEGWFEPFPLHPTFQEEVFPERYEARVEVPDGPYRPLSTLAPTYWAPTFREGDHSGGVQVLKPGVGILTSGEDLVGRHSYSLSGTFSTGDGSFDGFGSYVFAGLDSPLLGVSVSQIHDVDSRPWAGIVSDGDTVPLFRVERERALGLSATFLRNRSRSNATLRLSAAHVWEDSHFLEEDLEESTRFRAPRPEVRLAEGRAALTFGNARLFPFSMGPEDGVGLALRGRVRWDLTLADSLKGAAGWDRSFQDVVARVALYKGLHGPGFGNHVFGLRASGGVARGAGADASHFEVGGASGGSLPVQFLQVGTGLLFPLRGYSTAERFGRYAWSASLEYRFPMKLINGGLGLMPLHFDRLSGSLFLDGGNAWGPDLDPRGFRNPRRDPLASAGAEIVLRTMPLWFQNLDLRMGMAFPIAEGRDPQSYIRLGLSF